MGFMSVTVPRQVILWGVGLPRSDGDMKMPRTP